MSTRSLVEFDHDRLVTIEKNKEAFVNELLHCLRHLDDDPARRDLISGFGVRVYGVRHHSDPYHVAWGYNQTYTYDGDRK